MKQIILDTNFLLIPFTLKVDILTEIDKIIDEPYKLTILDRSIDELQKIAEEQSGKHKQAAKMALLLIKKKNINILKTKQKSLYMPINSKESVVDDIILKISDKNTIVATQDLPLRKRLSEKRVKTIILRSKKQVELK